jgi:predicted RNA-binding Zn ribbon-like protein
MAAYKEIVEGVELPARLGGHPALDFCNTRAGWGDASPVEYLERYEHLAVWAGFVGLLDRGHVATLRVEGERHARQAADILRRARDLRANLYELVHLETNAQATNPFAKELRAAAAAVRLTRRGDRYAWQVDVATGLAAPLLVTVWSAAEFLASPDVQLVRTCPGTGCGWVFIDRRGRRRWCAMAACGNRAKARRFATRHRGAAQRFSPGGESGLRSKSADRDLRRSTGKPHGS